MTPVTFSTAGFANLQGTPTIDLGLTLYVLETCFHDPISKGEQPVPSHFWALYQPDNAKVFFASSPSTEDGRCYIHSPKDGLPSGDYTLALYPLPDDVRAAYLSKKEAWIDLAPTSKRSDAPPFQWAAPRSTPLSRIDRRKLVRIPAWTAARQVKNFGGGFADSPPKARDHFAQTGLLNSAEIEPYGTTTTPWRIVLDHGWIKARVRYHFINWRDGKQEVLPPGLVVQATDDGGRLLGAGTAVDDSDGTAYVLVPRSLAKWNELNFAFAAPPRTRVDLSAPAATPDTRLTNDGTTPADRDMRNTLPNQWHSLGMQASYAPSTTATLGAIKTWSDLRRDIANDGAATEPVVVFHLDDLVLWGKDGPYEVDKGTRATMFDHLLAIRNSDAALPHLSKGRIDTPLIPAGLAFAIDLPSAPAAPTRIRDLSTRLINIQGAFFDLEEKRVVGTAGKTKWLGARAAVLGDHPIADYTNGCPYADGQGHHELHYIPAPFVKDPATNLELSHLLVYVGSKVVVNGDAAGAKGDLYRNLTYSSVRWSQGHPGVTQPPGSSPAKDYQLLPAAAGQRGADIVRLRFFFGTRTDGLHKFVVQLTHDSSASQDNRSFVRGDTMTYYDTACVRDAATSPRKHQDADGCPAYWHTLAHEFGHVCGLPDEYYEQVDPSVIDADGSLGLGLADPFLPRYDQYPGWRADLRPYYGDPYSMMRGNALLRLRHVWHHARAFSGDEAFAKVPRQPHVACHATYPGGGLEYGTPEGNVNNAYFPAVSGPMTGGPADQPFQGARRVGPSVPVHGIAG